MLVIDLPTTLSQKLDKLALSPQGLYIIDGMSLNVGVLPYLINDASVGIFTPEDELFATDSLNSLIGAGVTIEHPEEFLKSPDGMVGIVLTAFPNFEMSSDDGREGYYNIKLKIAVWDDKAVDYIKRGNTELSAGYDADVIEKEGTWFGSPYSYVKTNIRYNHLAIVAKGTARNGNASRLLIDNSIAKSCQDFNTFSIFNDVKKITSVSQLIDTKTTETDLTSVQSIKNKNMKTISLANGKTVEVSDESYADLHLYLESVNKTVHELTDVKTKKERELEVVTKELNDSKTTIEATKKEAENAKDSFGENVRIAAKAEKFGVKIDYEKFDSISVMRSALKDKYPNLDKADAGVIKYLFDITQYEEPKKEDETNNSTTGVTTSTTDSKRKVNTPMTQVIDASNGNVILDDKDEFTANDMSEIMAKKRRERVKK